MRSDEEPPAPPSPPPLPPTPPPPERSKLKQTLHSLRSPFRPGSPFHIGGGKRATSGKSLDAEGASSDAASPGSPKPRKKSKSKRGAADATGGGGAAGALVRKLSGMRRRRRRGDDANGDDSSASRASAPLPPAGDDDRPPSESPPLPPLASAEPDDEAEVDVDSHSSSTRDMDEASPEERAIPPPLPPLPPPATAQVPAAPAASGDTLATSHPVSTLPFTKSAWTKRVSPKIDRPVETPSPSDTLRRRIAFVDQASVFVSEDGGGVEEEEEEREEVGSLERAVELARVRLGRSAAHTPPAGRTSRTSSRGGDTETESDREPDEAMPAYGDLLVPQDKADAAPAPLASSHASGTGAGAGERREHLYKILVIGELGTGKTSIIKRYVHQFFSQHYRATIGVDFALKVLNWDANTVIRLQLWDIAGQERFGNMTRVYYKEAVGAFIVFDVTRVATFDAVLKWKTDLDSKVQLPDGSPIPCVLLANKCDQQKEGIVNTPAKMDEYCRERGFAGWFETSAKENVNIEEAARSLVNKILLNDKLLQSNDSKDNDRIALDHRIANGDGAEGSSRNCAC